MDFDISKVYTAVNADELHKGDLVYASYCIRVLKQTVQLDDEPQEIIAVCSEDNEYRFRTTDAVIDARSFSLAYLICPARNAEAYKAWKEGKDIEMQEPNACWIFVKPETLKTWEDFWYCNNVRVKQEPAPEPKYRPFKDVKELASDFQEKFNRYVSVCAMPLIWVQRKGCNERYLIAGFISTEENGELVQIGNNWYGLAVLLDNYTFLDGTPCGVKE